VIVSGPPLTPPAANFNGPHTTVTVNFAQFPHGGYLDPEGNAGPQISQFGLTGGTKTIASVAYDGFVDAHRVPSVLLTLSLVGTDPTHVTYVPGAFPPGQTLVVRPYSVPLTTDPYPVQAFSLLIT